MSMQTNINYGFGIDTYDINAIPDANLAAFARKHLKDWEDDPLNMSDAEVLEYIENISDERSNITSANAVVSNAITKETGIEVGYEEFEDQKAIMYYAGYPWQIHGEERDITPEKLQELFQPYLNELGIPDIKLDYVQVEYVG